MAGHAFDLQIDEDVLDVPMKPSKKLWAGFWICGVLNNYSFVVMMSAAEDIINGHAGVVLMANILPTLIIKLTAPFWAHKFSYRQRSVVNGLFGIASFYLVALFDPVEIKLLGVVCAAISSGWGEVTFLACTSHYHKDTVTAWSSGTGMAGIAGAGWYLLLNAVLGVSPRMTLIVGGVFPALYTFSYVMLIQRSVEGDPDLADAVPHAGQPAAGGYVKAEDGADGDGAGPEVVLGDGGGVGTGSSGSGGGAGGGGGVVMQLPSSRTQTMTFRERMQAIRPLWVYMLPLCVVYFSEYLANTGVHSTLGFKSMHKNTYYEWMSFVYQVGVFFSRSSGTLLPLQVLWPMPVGQALLVVLFILQSLKQLSPSPWPVLVLVLFEGFLGGACYVNAFRLISERVEPSLREFSLGAASVADTSGIVLAALVSLLTEPALDRYRRHHGMPGMEK